MNNKYLESLPEGQNSAPVLSEKPLRAVWAAGLLAAAWLLLAIAQLSFRRNLLCSTTAFICLSAAVLGASEYLVSQSALRLRIAGVGIGLASALLLTISLCIEYQLKTLQMYPGLGFFKTIPVLLFIINIGNSILAALLCLGAVLLFSVLRKKPCKRQVWSCGLIGGCVYLLIRLLSIIRRMIGIDFKLAMSLFSQEILYILTAALSICLVCVAVYKLCDMPFTHVKLRGLGLAWAWLALAGALFVIAFVIYVVALDPRLACRLGVYAFNLILGLSAFTGYLMLLCKRRAGLYFILIGAGLMFCTNVIEVLTGFRIGMLGRLLYTLPGALNPLFAWLAVRAADRQSCGQSKIEELPAE